MRSKWVIWAKTQNVKGGSLRSVLNAIADHANGDGKCFPSIATLADATGYSTRTVQSKIVELEALGLLQREIGGGWVSKGKGRANRFQLLEAVPEPAADQHGYPAPAAPLIAGYPARAAPLPTENIEENRELPCTACRGSEVSKKVGGGGAHACARPPASEHARGPTPSAKPPAETAENGSREPPPPARQIDGERLGSLLEAIGWPRSGQKPNGGIAGNADDLAEVRAWTEELGLSHADQLKVIREVIPTKADPGPPDRFRYFSKAMARYAGKRERAPLKPIYPNEKQGNRANEPSRKRDQLPVYILNAARGTTI